MTAPQAPVRNSFLKAMALSVIVVIPIIVVSIRGGKNAEAAGEFAGWLSTGPILGGIAVGIWAKLDKRVWNWFDYIWRFVVCSVAIFVVSTASQAGRSTPKTADVTEAEKQHLVVSGTDVHHTDFGFSVRLPSPNFGIDSALQHQTNQQIAERGARGTYMWILQDPAMSGAVMVILTKGVGKQADELRAFGRGIRRGATKQGAQLLEDTTQWSADAHEYRFAMVLPEGGYAKVRCLPSRGDQPFIVCVQTVSADPNGFDDVRAGVTLASWQ